VPIGKLEQSRMARTLMMDLVADPRLISLDDIYGALHKMEKHILKQDPLAKLEILWLKRSATSLTALIQKKILAALPTEAASIDISASHAALINLRQEKYVKAASPAILGIFDAILTMLGNMKLDISPVIDDSTSPFFVQVVGRCAFFCRHETAGSSTAASVSLAGHAALMAKVEQWENDLAHDGQIIAKDLESLKRYRWLFTAPELDRVAGPGTNITQLLNQRRAGFWKRATQRSKAPPSQPKSLC